MNKMILGLTVLMAGISAQALTCGVFSTNPQNTLAMKEITQRQEFIFEEGTTKYGVATMENNQYAIFIVQNDTTISMAAGPAGASISLLRSDLNRIMACGNGN